MQSLLFFILAAFCYTAPFVVPDYCGIFIFFFPSCLFLALAHASYYALFSWSLVVIMIHFLPLCDALIHMASGPLLIRLLPPCILVFYSTLYPMLWLCSMRILLHQSFSFTKQLIMWTLGLWAYCMIIDQLLFWPFGRIEGFLFMHPLLPLSIWPAWIRCITALPPIIALLWFCVASSLITNLMLHFTNKGLFLLCCIGLSCIGLVPRQPPPPWLSTIGHLPLLLPPTIDSTMGIVLLTQEIKMLHAKHPLITTVILPESAWNSTTLSDIDIFPHALQNLIIGSFGEDYGTYFNRLYCFSNGTIYHYDKRHAVPLTERSLSFVPILNQRLFFQKSPSITAAQNQRPRWILPSIGPCIPYICSELFCNTSPDDLWHDPIMCLVNDWWFMPHFQKLMALAARFQALRWQRPILYISYYYAQFFNQYGQSAPIATTAEKRFIS